MKKLGMWRVFKTAAKAAGNTPGGGEEFDANDIPLMDAFQKFDQNGDGFIDKEELAELLQKYLQMDSPPTDKQIAKIMARVDLDQDGKIDFTDFKKLMMDTAEDETTKYYATFKTFDRDNDGFITYIDLEEILLLVHPDMKEEDIKSIMTALDQDQDGKINYNEFLNYFKV